MLSIPPNAQVHLTDVADEEALLNSDRAAYEEVDIGEDEGDDLFFGSYMENSKRERRTSKLNKATENEFRVVESNSTWTDANTTISTKNSHLHLQKASYSITNPLLLTHLKASAPMMKSLQTEQAATKEQIGFIRDKVDESLLYHKTDVKKMFKTFEQK